MTEWVNSNGEPYRPDPDNEAAENTELLRRLQLEAQSCEKIGRLFLLYGQIEFTVKRLTCLYSGEDFEQYDYRTQKQRSFDTINDLRKAGSARRTTLSQRETDMFDHVVSELVKLKDHRNLVAHARWVPRENGLVALKRGGDGTYQLFYREPDKLDEINRSAHVLWAQILSLLPLSERMIFDPAHGTHWTDVIE